MKQKNGQALYLSIFVSFIRSVIAATRAAATAAPAAGAAGATFLAMTMTFCMRAIHCKARPANGVVNEIDRGVSQIVDGDFIYNNFYAVRFESRVNIADVVVQCHTEIYTATTTTSNIDAQGVPFEISFGQNERPTR